ncbi:PREDICTED: uracil-DNA glycosylase, mitochondrial isoform X2 [Tarenaya hassleriana]|nr:PREDICTED: uracil-DNA glycosylase, mitochondrial isoform X2 [Tarenaya hassleriana]
MSSHHFDVRLLKDMASSTAKTLMDFFQPAKRLKVSPSSSPTAPVSVSVVAAAGERSSGSPPRKTLATAVSGDSSGLTPDQASRVEFNKLLAMSRRNLAVCSEKVSKAKAEGRCYVPLEELLVEKSWLEALPGELQRPYAKVLCDFLEREICANGGPPIYPPHHLIFNALNTTPFHRVKAVIIGQDPYHGPGQAMGLSFSVPEGQKLPSSLMNIFKELKEDLGCSVSPHGNLQKWAVQGVLLLNAVLTVKSKQPNSHAKKGWEQFTDAVIQNISQQKEGVVFLLWGRYAQEKSK